jgi:hypothetical protein
VSPYQEVSRNASTAGITLFTPAFRVTLERPPGRTPHCFAQIPINGNSSLFERGTYALAGVYQRFCSGVKGSPARQRLELTNFPSDLH